jgi:hypothetical protein
MYHRNGRNEWNGGEIHHFAKLARQLAAVLSAFFTEKRIIFFKKMKNGFNEDGAA